MENKEPGDDLFDRLNVSISLHSSFKDCQLQDVRTYQSQLVCH